MNIHLAVSSQVPDQAKVNEIQKVFPLMVSLGTAFWKDYMNIIVYFFPTMLALIGLCINTLEKNFMEINNEVYQAMCSVTKGMASVIIRNLF